MSTVYGPEALLKDVYEKNLCIGCGACVDLCPYFKSHKGKTAMTFPCDMEKGSCHAYCPKAEVDFDALSRFLWKKPYDGSPLGHYRKIIAGRAGEKLPPASYQAGGTVSAIISYALSADLIDAAVLTDRDGLVPVPRLATSAADVIECASSKYLTAPTVSALLQGIKSGFNRMGIVGTPCQITAAAQFRSNPMEEPGFKDPVSLTVGLFCTWTLDTRKLMSFLSHRVAVEKIRKMDIPPPPAEVFEIDTEDGPMRIPLDEIRHLCPDGCKICPDMTSEWADISVGNLEGDAGWNSIIIRSENGDRLVEDAIQAGWLISKKMPAHKLDHLVSAAAGKKKKALVRAQAEGLLNRNEDGMRSAIRIGTDGVDRIIGGKED